VETSNLPVLEADARQMAQLFRHLVENALKFHRPGTPPRVQVQGEAIAGGSAAGAEEWWRIVITDNGQGFEERFNERIFGVFQRLHDPEQYAGTGIGLALCRKIVERHGGAIEAAGQPGEGARFTIALPARQQPKEAEP
jgi:signal transduction histidine kinase